MLLLLIFAAGLDASLIFWMHEEVNKGRHIQYAKELVVRRDTIAENHLVKLAELDKADQPVKKDLYFWEKQWLNNPYLSSNYRFSFLNDTVDSSLVFYQPIFTIDDNSTPFYRISFPENYSLFFELKKDFKRSVYTANHPFKNLERLRDFQFAVVDHNEVVLANSHNFDLNVLDVQLPSVGKWQKVELNGFDVVVYRHSDKVYALIGEPLSEVQVWVSNFTFFFSLLIIIAVLYKIIKLIFYRKRVLSFWRAQPIQARIQTVLITLTLSLFFIIAITTFFFLRQNNQELAYDRQFYIAETVRKAILEDKKLFNWDLNDFPVSSLSELADRKQCEIDVYNAKGELIVSSIATAENSPALKLIEKDVQEKLHQTHSAIFVKPFKKDDENCLRSIFSITKNKELEGFLAINTFETEIGTAQDIPIIMGKLLNVYVLLLLLTWGVGLLLINFLTQPLSLLADRLSSFKPGNENEKLFWSGHDTIGKLIGEYNKMVDVVEQTTKELVKSEREGAWQIMAQQIAHEINNPLTSLKLNIQFLAQMLHKPETVDPNSARRITDRLVEQIDNLALVASQFRLFAMLDTPEAKPTDLKTFLEQFFNTYNQKEHFQYHLSIELPNDTSPIILIDAQHLDRVLQNIISNAENALSEKQAGVITLRLKESKDKAVIEIEDNGNGIAEQIVEQIFDPKFSTNSSATGLGLPICLRIIEFYNGELSFTSQPGEGTCFQIVFSVTKKQPSLI